MSRAGLRLNHLFTACKTCRPGASQAVRPCTGVCCVTDVLTAVPHDHEGTSAQSLSHTRHCVLPDCETTTMEARGIIHTPGISCGWRAHICLIASLVTCAVSRRTIPLSTTLAGLSDHQRHCFKLLNRCNRKGGQNESQRTRENTAQPKKYGDMPQVVSSLPVNFF